MTGAYVIRVTDPDEDAAPSFWGPFPTRGAAQVVADEVESMSGAECYVEMVRQPEAYDGHSLAAWIVAAS